jgi:hypothetical protein
VGRLVGGWGTDDPEAAGSGQARAEGDQAIAFVACQYRCRPARLTGDHNRHRLTIGVVVEGRLGRSHPPNRFVVVEPAWRDTAPELGLVRNSQIVDVLASIYVGCHLSAADVSGA